MSSSETSPAPPSTVSAFYLVGGFLMLIGFALLGLRLGFAASFGPAYLIVAMVAIVVSGLFLVYPQFLGSRIAAAGAFDISVKRATDLVGDIDAVRRAYFKLQQESEGMHRTMLEEARQAVDSSLRVRRVEEELFEARRQVAEANRETAQWISAAQEFAGGLERMLTHGGLAPDVVSTAERALADFSRAVEPLGFRCIRPNKGDAFDDRIHRATGQAETEGNMDGKIVSCSSWGFAEGATLLRKADVMLGANPSTSNTDQEAEKSGVVSALPVVGATAVPVSANVEPNESEVTASGPDESHRQEEGAVRD